MKVELYCLGLANNKYYVGQTDNSSFRFTEHKAGLGSKWTRLHSPIKILKTKVIEVLNGREATLYENWMTLYYMEKYGWQNVRGGEYNTIEEYKIKDQINHIYDIERNKIKYFIKSPYLFGASDNWLLYVLELENSKYYIGSTKRLGKSIGRIFKGVGPKWIKENRPIKITDLKVIKSKEQNYRNAKQELLLHYINIYGGTNVIGGSQK